ncbi:hypothetical protein [Anaerocolumna aminovalerica]|uniref:hypothetical protein n=1 Tax=Anaerocolumna aminovalerica TaxID=1527 RepID=UPI001FA81C39|nr:hypothetical protein [Anaerocolumna aminovalerica]
MNDKLIRYSIQIAMLKQLLSRNLISDKEYSFESIGVPTKSWIGCLAVQEIVRTPL